MTENISIDREKIASFCERHHIIKLSLFGSILTDQFHPDSDVDVLVRYESGAVVGFRIIDMEEELSALFGGRSVDIVSEKYLNHRLRDRILAEAEVQYAQG
jgi:uncharacterized protein